LTIEDTDEGKVKKKKKGSQTYGKLNRRGMLESQEEEDWGRRL
jgi:hypothetical protein